ncbi:MAG TPA: alpha/beta hydrolase [Chloroflexi bacterium]|nr:alpha/beta hydrolase [Chloroflexota bacterium]
MPYAKTSQGKLFYTLSQGSAAEPTLVLIHGAGGSRLHWPAELRRLPGATVYTIDLPGHGRSEGPGCSSIEEYARAITDLLDAAGINVPTVIPVGHSMGGAIGMTLALDFPDRVAGLVLIATGAKLRVAPAILAGIQSDLEASADLITQYAWASQAPSHLMDAGRQVILETGADVLLQDFTACDHFDVMERLGDIHAPTLIVAGSADQLTPVKYAHFLAERIAQARLVTIAEAGHMVMLEQPTKVEKAVRAFLNT